MKTLIIDFDGVFVPDEYRCFRAVCPDESAIIRIEEPFYSKSDSAPLWDLLRAYFKIELTNEELIALYNLEDAEQLAHEEGMMSLVKELSKTRQIVLLSNQINDRTQHLRKTRDFSSFAHVFFSSEIGSSKPDQKIFEFVLREICAKPEDCLFVDDGQENLDAASKLGIKGIQFTSIDQLKDALK